MGKTPLIGHVFLNGPELWKLENQELRAGKGVKGDYLRFGDPGWTDCDIELEANRREGDGDMVVVLRGANQANLAQVNIKGGNVQCAVHTLTEGKWALLSSRPGAIENNRWYRVKIQVRGNRAVVYLDGERVLEATGLLSARGQIGLRSWGPASFRNIKVTDPDGKVLFDGLPYIHLAPPNGAWPQLP